MCAAPSCLGREVSQIYCPGMCPGTDVFKLALRALAQKTQTEQGPEVFLENHLSAMIGPTIPL